MDKEELEERLERMERQQEQLIKLVRSSGSRFDRFLALLEGGEVPEPKAQKVQGKAALVLRHGSRKAKRS